MMAQEAAGHAAETAVAAGTPAAAEGAAHAAVGSAHEGPFEAGDFIFHHILDSQTLDLPFVGEVHLPTLHLGPYDLPITKHAVMMWIASALVLLALWLATRRRAPAPRGMHNVMEAMVVFVRDELARKNIGHGGDRFVPYLLSTFVFILFCNLLGLFPYMATATGNIGVTAALAGLAFVMIQVSGIREHGVVGHFRNLVPHGLPVWLMPIMIPVEILGMLTKPFTLCVRLWANMTAGHVVIMALISLVFILQKAWVGAVLTVPFALFINGIELLVVFLQAYIFTMLTSLFIGMTVHPQH
jgi:F-type H+-transporting ATPase subunit a